MTVQLYQVSKPNFDVSHELEELLLEERPLKVKRRKPNRDLSSLSPELRQMEEQYACLSVLKHFQSLISTRFTAYNFQKTRRQTYYPFNQEIVSSITSLTSDLDMESSRPPTPATFIDPERLAAEAPSATS
jgi:serine/threonine kinase 32